MGIADMYTGGLDQTPMLDAAGRPMASAPEAPVANLNAVPTAAPAPSTENSIGSFYGAPAAQSGDMTSGPLLAPAPVTAPPHAMDQKRALLAFGLGNPATVY